MKLALLIGAVAVAGAAVAAYRPAQRAFVSSGVDTAAARYLGYIEGETTLVAPPVAGRLVTRPFERGDRVKKGDTLFAIDTTLAEEEVARAKASLAEAQARHTNLLTGKRSEEQDVIRAQRQEVEATLAAAEADHARQHELMVKKIVSRQVYDQKATEVAELRARVAALAAKERVGNLAARPQEIDAAEALVAQQRALLARARTELAELAPVAPEDALIENTLFNVGEWVPAGAPIVSLLPDFRIKLRFFIPETDMAKTRAGVRVRFGCDGCPPDLGATVTYVSPRAEYTPPIIYAQGTRARLVYLVEARTDPTVKHPLQPGMPISVDAISPNAKSWAWR